MRVGARAHIGEVLALAHDELESTRAQLVRAVDELRAVQGGIERSLGEVSDLPELVTVDDLVDVPTPAVEPMAQPDPPESGPAVGAPAAPVPAPVRLVEPEAPRPPGLEHPAPAPVGAGEGPTDPVR